VVQPIDFIRQRNARKRGGEFEITQFDSQVGEQGFEPNGEKIALQRLSEALDELALHDARLAEVVD
jgi:hypothetical protein